MERKMEILHDIRNRWIFFLLPLQEVLKETEKKKSLS